MNQPPPAPAPIREIKLMTPSNFGKGAELKERLMVILRDVPVLHERLNKVTADLERVSGEFKVATEKAKAIVDEWDRIQKEEKGS